MPDQIYGVTWNGDEKVNYTYDSLGRLTNKVVGGNIPQPFNTTYSYVDVDDTKTTTLLSSITTTNLIYNELIPELNFLTYNYEYDELGNITSIEFFGFETTYEYDELNQLVRENDEKSDVTYTYEYVNGNIKYKHQYAYTTGTLPETPQKTTEYHYEDDVWCDVLTKITETNYSSNNTSTYSLRGNTSTNPLADFLFGDNCNTVDLTENAIINVGDDDLGVPSRNSTYSLNSNTTEIATIQSDTIGNITNIGDVTIDWNGRRLESIGQGGIELVTYDYNMDGQRVKKNVTDPTTNTTVTTEYFYNGDILAGQKKGNDVLIFMYDNNGDTFGFTYNGTPYYYVKNAQNDVVMIVDETNHIVVYYEYDAWGKVIYCNDTSGFDLASINPIMYRSYYVDLEMGLFVYYLNSRYYIADWGRFASADSVVDNRGMSTQNLFQYCWNSPTNKVDIEGKWTVGVFVSPNITLALGASIGIGIVFDNSGNIDLQWNYAAYNVDDTVHIGAFDVGIGAILQVTNADTVYNLYGTSTAMGFSVGDSAYVGVDVITFSDPMADDADFDGFQITVGYGWGFDTHIVRSNTKPIVEPIFVPFASNNDIIVAPPRVNKPDPDIGKKILNPFNFSR